MGLIAEGKVLLSSDTFPQHGAPLRTLCLLSVRAGQPCGLWVCTLQQKASTSAPNSVIYRAWGNFFLPCIAYAGMAEQSGFYPFEKHYRCVIALSKIEAETLMGKGKVTLSVTAN